MAPKKAPAAPAVEQVTLGGWWWVRVCLAAQLGC